ncbi:DUF1761 domain-containing protein [Thalassococcus sp. S3]|uniref:DUF1761 domain-containing protein n=1 Tax=Thalassococcus sp. S3 TaxID=2017482 RepID=UPI0010249133|nr:DUF1761 domain-containing protein [Thalassococcus sp. S3]QBF29629.1 hypothetical protein CFI11_00160 [Thalassococcus sp. S3]
MEVLNVLAAATGSFAFGAIWYTVLAKPWMAASGVEVNPDTGQPANASDPIPYVTSFVCCILVAGMMRHVFTLSNIDTIGEGLVSGFGVGLFLVSPWIATFYGFGGRPRQLTLIDCGYATGGCTIIGAILTLF